MVKRYPDGELGKMLHRAVPNPTVPQLEVRGPVDTWSFERDSAATGVPERIVMVVGGTGDYAGVPVADESVWSTRAKGCDAKAEGNAED